MNTPSFVKDVDAAFIFVCVISVVILIGITVAMIWFVIRYHHSRHPVGKDIHGNVWLELAWTIIPTLLVFAMFWYGYKGYEEMAKIPADALNVSVTGRTWEWAFEYENGISSDTLYVPVEQNISLDLNSVDVLHSFYIPAFRVKMDVVPGLVTRMWFRAAEAKNYDVFCAEYCGDDHSIMYTKVVALPQAEFDRWYQEGGKKAAAE